MPGRVQAQGQELFGNVGGPMAPRYGVDIPGSIDAFANGSSSLIHQAYLRKVNERDYQERRQQGEEARQFRTAELQRQTEKDARDDAFRERESMRRFKENGGVPEHATDVPVPGATTQLQRTAAPMSPIQQAMTGGAVGMQQTPSTTPLPTASMPLTQPGMDRVTVPESVDPTKSISYSRIMDAVTARSAGQLAVEGKRQEGRTNQDAARHTFKLEEIADKAGFDAERSKNHDNRTAAAKAAGGGSGGRPLTANGMEAAKRALLPGLASYHGTEAQLREYLTNDEVGKATAQKYGITDADIAAAVGKDRATQTKQTVQISPTNPARGVKRLRDARAAVDSASKVPQGGAAVKPTAQLSKTQKQMAQSDGGFAAHLKAMGYKDADWK